jgi:putative redox protein
MATVTVRHLVGDRFAINTRSHRLTVDQPLADGGDDTAPTPTELFVAGLASCVAHYARRYLARHDLPTDGLSVTADYEFAARPARVAGVRIWVMLPDGIPADRREAALAVASHCTVHNSLTNPPEVVIALREMSAPAA